MVVGKSIFGDAGADFSEVVGPEFCCVLEESCNVSVGLVEVDSSG
jgi:hypothetical protein